MTKSNYRVKIIKLLLLIYFLLARKTRGINKDLKEINNNIKTKYLIISNTKKILRDINKFNFNNETPKNL